MKVNIWAHHNLKVETVTISNFNQLNNRIEWYKNRKSWVECFNYKDTWDLYSPIGHKSDLVQYCCYICSTGKKDRIILRNDEVIYLCSTRSEYSYTFDTLENARLYFLRLFPNAVIKYNSQSNLYKIGDLVEFIDDYTFSTNGLMQPIKYKKGDIIRIFDIGYGDTFLKNYGIYSNYDWVIASPVPYKDFFPKNNSNDWDWFGYCPIPINKVKIKFIK